MRIKVNQKKKMKIQLLVVKKIMMMMNMMELNLMGKLQKKIVKIYPPKKINMNLIFIN